jgi:hypothetical protein
MNIETNGIIKGCSIVTLVIGLNYNIKVKTHRAYRLRIEVAKI